MTQYPKILIIGQSFDKKTGGGVTMSNLFTGWPKDKIAVASNINLQTNLDPTVCDTYYQLAYNNKLHPFPLGLVLPKIQTGLQPKKSVHLASTANNSTTAQSGKYKFVYNILCVTMHFFGVYNLLYKLKITPDFRQWLQEYNPDVIYTQLASLEYIRFIQKLYDTTGKKIAIHIMDDWPLTINKSGIFYNYWQRRIDVEFRQLMKQSKIIMSISDAMGQEYKKRYGVESVPFHNPIDISFWKPTTVKNYAVKNKFTILYAGRIGFGIANSIKEIAAAVTELAVTHNNILFEIQTVDAEAAQALITVNDNVKIVPPTAYSALPERFVNADLLLLPQDFDKASVLFLRYSFPTKVSEYMISGTPILVYGDASTGLTKYALQEQWAYVVTEHSQQKLVHALNDLYTNEVLRKNLAIKAKKIAEEREDAIKVREAFKNSLLFNVN
jgi:glycosyltransferase involved in cell wall biosynthesis